MTFNTDVVMGLGSGHAPLPCHTLECPGLAYYCEYLVGITILCKVSPGYINFSKPGLYLQVTEQAAAISGLTTSACLGSALPFPGDKGPANCFCKCKHTATGSDLALSRMKFYL